MRITGRLSLWVLVLAALLAAGCGYHFAASGSGLPSSARTIYVARFGNKSRFTGVNDEFMRYLKDEIADHKRLELVDNPADADLKLNGDITYMNTGAAAFNEVNEPILSSETLTVDATLVDARTRSVIWSTRGMTGTQQFPIIAQTVVTTSPVFLQQNLRSQDIAKLTDIQVAATQEAVSEQQMMQQLARNLYASMSEGF